LILREAEEEIGLVLRLIGGACEDPALTSLVEVVAGVVTGGDAVSADLSSGDEELVELEVVVAECAGDGSASSEVLGDEGTDNFGFETGLLIHHIVWDVQLLSDVARVVDVIDAAAATLNRLGHALVSGEAALVPELKSETNERVTLSAQKCGDG
jgi:hypothetical protein